MSPAQNSGEIIKKTRFFSGSGVKLISPDSCIFVQESFQPLKKNDFAGWIWKTDPLQYLDRHFCSICATLASLISTWSCSYCCCIRNSFFIFAPVRVRVRACVCVRYRTIRQWIQINKMWSVEAMLLYFYFIWSALLWCERRFCLRMKTNPKTKEKNIYIRKCVSRYRSVYWTSATATVWLSVRGLHIICLGKDVEVET